MLKNRLLQLFLQSSFAKGLKCCKGRGIDLEQRKPTFEWDKVDLCPPH